MKKLSERLAVAFYVVVGLISVYYMYLAMKTPLPQPGRDRLCSVAEISPDITPAERERCRQIRGHKL
jgi:hypothetical protein